MKVDKCAGQSESGASSSSAHPPQVNQESGAFNQRNGMPPFRLGHTFVFMRTFLPSLLRMIYIEPAQHWLGVSVRSCRVGNVSGSKPKTIVPSCIITLREFGDSVEVFKVRA